MSELVGWDYLKTLATEYLALIQDGYPAELDKRIPGQVNLANQIVEGVVPFLYKLVRQYIKEGLEISTPHGKRLLRSNFKGNIDELVIDGLVSAASLRVFTALPSYRPDLYAFSTFVGNNATSAIHREARNSTYIIDIPEGVMSKCRKLLSDKPKLVEELGVNAARSLELAVNGFYFDFNHILSFYEPDFDSVDLVPVMLDALSELPEREQAVLRCRFGLDGDELTLDETAEFIAADGHRFTKERIRQIESGALEFLYRTLRRKITV